VFCTPPLVIRTTNSRYFLRYHYTGTYYLLDIILHGALKSIMDIIQKPEGFYYCFQYPSAIRCHLSVELWCDFRNKFKTRNFYEPISNVLENQISRKESIRIPLNVSFIFIFERFEWKKSDGFPYQEKIAKVKNQFREITSKVE